MPVLATIRNFGRDGFHSVPESEYKIWDAVERVPTVLISPNKVTQLASARGLGLIRPANPFTASNWRGRLAVQNQAMQFGWVLSLVVLHAALGVLCKHSRWFATAHALGTFVLGLCLVFAPRGQFRVACWSAYVVGAEVLWRMTGAYLPWEYAKYAVSLVLLISWLRSRPRIIPKPPLIYFLLLLPAAIPTLAEAPLSEVRKLISFNLSGPLSIMACALFFSRVQLDERRMGRLMAWLIFPLSAIAAAILFGLSTSANVEFGSGANFAASGGFGPNQVSGSLGLGALYGLLLALDLRLNTKLRLLFLALSLWFAAHSALSFSRTGLYLLAAGLLAAAPFLSLRGLLSPKNLILACVALVAGLATWAYLVRFTGGMISSRFANTGVTGRDRIAGLDLEIWKQNTLSGVGLGLSAKDRAQSAGDFHASHVEYTRLLAEHGLFGLAAAVFLLVVSLRPLVTGLSGFTKAAVVAGVVWALASMLASAMRTALPGFLIGLGYAQAALAHKGRTRWGTQSAVGWSGEPAVTGPPSTISRSPVKARRGQ
jgi:hypothetical protein